MTIGTYGSATYGSGTYGNPSEVWVLVPNVQNPSWTHVVTVQASGWVPVPTVQGPNWTQMIN
jgi:hypothetical protein